MSMSDNKEKHLYYVGNIGLDYTAMYVHCQGIANLYSRIGYKTVFLCVDDQLRRRAKDKSLLFQQI